MAKRTQIDKVPTNIYVIRWVDVQSVEYTLCFPEDLPNEPVVCSLVGFMVRQDKNNYYMAKEVWDTGQCKYVHIIPKKYVIEIYSVLLESMELI